MSESAVSAKRSWGSFGAKPAQSETPVRAAAKRRPAGRGRSGWKMRSQPLLSIAECRWIWGKPLAKLARWAPRQTMTETEKLFLTLTVTFVGSGLGTTIVAALLKRRFDAQLETQKALLQRSSRIHERQVDALLVIHAKLEQALFYLQRAASAGKFAASRIRNCWRGWHAISQPRPMHSLRTNFSLGRS